MAIQYRRIGLMLALLSGLAAGCGTKSRPGTGSLKGSDAPTTSVPTLSTSVSPSSTSAGAPTTSPPTSTTTAATTTTATTTMMSVADAQAILDDDEAIAGE